jgi:hypothetical protein
VELQRKLCLGSLLRKLSCAFTLQREEATAVSFSSHPASRTRRVAALPSGAALPLLDAVIMHKQQAANRRQTVTNWRPAWTPPRPHETQRRPDTPEHHMTRLLQTLPDSFANCNVTQPRGCSHQSTRDRAIQASILPVARPPIRPRSVFYTHPRCLGAPLSYVIDGPSTGTAC